MYGVWAFDSRGADPGAPAFDIPMQGLGVFACRRDAWPGFNRSFRGFGGEEGYIHEKIRQRAGRTLCLPFLRWVHRFARPLGTPYPNRWEERIRNYFVGFTELGLDTAPMEAHFAELLGAERASRMFDELRATPPVTSRALRDDLEAGAWPPRVNAVQPPARGGGQGQSEEPVSLDELYQRAANDPSDINEHVPTLRRLASEAQVVVEFGVRHGVSTLGLLTA
jgi:hypothetical protein